jgi:hypothetical protein
MDKKSQKMKMNVDSDTSNITNKDITSKLVDADEPSALIMEVFTMLKQLMVTVNQNKVSLMEMKADQALLNETLAEMRSSLKLLEVAVCTQDRDILPTSHKTSRKVHMEVGVDSDKGKGVAVEWDDDDANNDIMFDVPDEENDDNAMKTYHYIPTPNVETTLDTVMPVIPEIWTKPYTSNSKKSTKADHQIVKKLTFGSPPPSGTNMMNFDEGTGSEPLETPTPSLPLLNIKKRSRTPDIPKAVRTPSSYLPKKFTTKLLFKCTAEMFLEPAEIQVCAYLFYKFGKKE